MTAERWIKQLGMYEKVRSSVLAKEKKFAAEQEAIMLAAEKRAWLRELEQTNSYGSCTLPTDERGKNGLQNTGHDL